MKKQIKKWQVIATVLVIAFCKFSHAEVKEGITAERPIIHKVFPLTVLPTNPVSGEVVTIVFTVPNARRLDLVVSGDGCGDLESMQLKATSKLEQSKRAGNKGFCSIKATARTSAGELKFVSMYDVKEIKVQPPVLMVENASFTPSVMLPEPSTKKGSPFITGITAPDKLIRGQDSIFAVDLKDKDKLDSISNVLLSIKDVDGYFSVPARVENNKVVFDINMDRESMDLTAPTRMPDNGGGLGTILGFSIQVEDQDGRVSNIVKQLISMVEADH